LDLKEVRDVDSPLLILPIFINHDGKNLFSLKDSLPKLVPDATLGLALDLLRGHRVSLSPDPTFLLSLQQMTVWDILNSIP
jgi:hypothetical protein